MSIYESFLAALEKFSGERQQSKENPVAQSKEIFDGAASTDILKIVAQADIPIFTASPAEIERWHKNCACRWLNDLIAPYDLSFWSCRDGGGDKAMHVFKIGWDKEEQFATFALDETHYLRIDFDYDEPRDMDYAKKVLETINHIRKIKCGA